MAHLEAPSHVDRSIRTRRRACRPQRLVFLAALSIGVWQAAQAKPAREAATGSGAIAEAAAETSAGRLPALDPGAALRASQMAIGRQTGDYTLLDRRGRPVHLSSYRGKPLLVSFIYTGCFQVCPTGTRSLQESVQSLQKVLGAGRFNVISIGFNQPADSPQALRAFALQHGVDAPDWEFLSPPAAIVEALTQDFGFSYVATPAGFDHLLAATVVDAQGRVYSQVYGERLTADKLGEPLRQLLRGAPLPASLQLADVIERVRLLCSVYDPETGQYRYDYGLILEIAGGVTFALAMLWFFLAEWRERRLSRRPSRLGGQAAAVTRR